VLAAVAAATGCSDGEIMLPPPTPTLIVSALSTGGEFDVDGYEIMVGGESRGLIDVNDTVYIPRVGLGEQTVELRDLASNCTVEGSSVRSVVIGSGPASLLFRTVCKPSAGLAAIRMLFSRRHSGLLDIYAMQLDGSALVRLTADPVYDDGDPAISRDGSRIAFMKYAPWRATGRRMPAFTSCMRTARMRFDRPRQMSTLPDWSPDGRASRSLFGKTGRFCESVTRFH
jgi:hypothetical protein